MIVPIHNHTEYSALDGLSSCLEIAERCVEIGCTCCGITDHGVVSGHLEFDKVLRSKGIKPIFGCELYHGVKTEFAKNERDQAHFVAGAITDEGLRNLWRLVDNSAHNARYVGRVNWDMLSKHNEGLFATSACIAGLVPRGIMKDDLSPLNKYLEIFGDRFFIEIHTYPGDEQEAINKALVSLAQERGIPLVYATDAHFATRDQYEIHDIYQMVKGETITTPPEDRKLWHPPALWIKDEQEIRDSLTYLPDDVVDECIRNSVTLGEMCDAHLPEVKNHFPAFIPVESPWVRTEDRDLESSTLFIDLVEKGIEERYEVITEDVIDRVEHELNVILGAGLEDYFLLAWDTCKYAYENKIEKGPGRGSSAGSIIAYALYITDIDPLKYGLIFERFYNAGRSDGLPDIDTDFPSENRKEIIDYLKKRWGESRVKQIGNTTRMKPKAALDRFWGKIGVTYEEKEEVKTMMMQALPTIDILDSKAVGWSRESDPGKYLYVIDGEQDEDGAWVNGIGEKLEEWIESKPENRRELLRVWLDIVDIVCSRVEGYGTHASGVVISDVDLDDELPGRWIASEKIIVTQFPMEDVDKRKFMKLDILAVKALDIIAKWRKRIKEKYDIEFEWTDVEKEDYSDTEMWNMVNSGFPLGIFQIEKGLPARLCKQLQPNSIEELAVITALNRPGPIGSGTPDAFIRRKSGEEDTVYDHPILEPILDETYGEFLYQEGIINFFVALGYSPSEADAVRKILGKKRPEQLGPIYRGEGEWEDKSYVDMAEAAGIEKSEADHIWHKMENFAKYSFNKAHSVSYGALGARTIYCKHNGPLDWVISSIEVKPDTTPQWIVESRRRNIAVSPPDILRSKVSVEDIEGEVLYGLANIKGIGVGTARYIVKLREEYDISTPELLEAALAEAKIKWEATRDAAKEKGVTFKEQSPNSMVKSSAIEALRNAGAFTPYVDDDISLQQRQKWEKEYLGVILTDFAYDILEKNEVELADCDDYATIDSAEIGQTIKVPGVVSEINERNARRDNTPMAIVKIEYQDSEAEFLVWDKQVKQYKYLLKERTPGIFEIKKSAKGLSLVDATKLS